MEEAPSSASRKPWVVWGACLISVFVFVGLSFESPTPDWDVLAKWGAPPPTTIWNGAYWALLTTVFVHADALHLAANVYWLWVLGGALERAIGSLRFLGFFVAAGITASGAELGASSTPGIGLSGVGYAIFAFLWVARSKIPKLQGVLTRRIVLLFLLWLVACVWLDYVGAWEVGNAAHLFGLLFGLALGWTLSVGWKRKVGWGAAAALLLVSLVPLWWMPWSMYWNDHRGYEAHLKDDYPRAIQYYERSLALEPENAWTLENLALALYASGRDDEAEAIRQRLRRVDPKAADEFERRWQTPEEDPPAGRPR